jgi:hypothetical protein
MVSMMSRSSDPTGTEPSDPDIRMVYRSVSQGGALDWYLLVSIFQLSLLTHFRLTLTYGKVGFFS